MKVSFIHVDLLARDMCKAACISLDGLFLASQKTVGCLDQSISAHSHIVIFQDTDIVAYSNYLSKGLIMLSNMHQLFNLHRPAFLKTKCIKYLSIDRHE